MADIVDKGVVDRRYGIYLENRRIYAAGCGWRDDLFDCCEFLQLKQLQALENYCEARFFHMLEIFRYMSSINSEQLH